MAGGSPPPSSGRVDGTRLTLIRHCATAHNEARRYQGHEDLPLSPAGREMAVELGRTLVGRGITPEKVWVSDLRRATETAALALPDAEQRADPRLRELDFGAFSGATYDENLSAYGDAFRRWLLDPDAFPPPGGERLSNLWRRVATWAEDLPSADDAVAVLHVGSMKALVSWALGVPFGSVLPRHLPIGAIVELAVRDGRWHAVSGWHDDLTAAPRPAESSGPSAAWPGTSPAVPDDDE